MGGNFAQNTVIGIFDDYRDATQWAKEFEEVAKWMGLDARAIAFPRNDSEGRGFVFNEEFAQTLGASATTPRMVLESAQKLVETLRHAPICM